MALRDGTLRLKTEGKRGNEGEGEQGKADEAQKAIKGDTLSPAVKIASGNCH